MKLRQLLWIFFITFFTLMPLHAAEKMKVIVDTDCDMDDMMAILFLLKKKDVEVVAITTTGTGMAQWQYSAPNILKLLELAHKADIPVSYGAKNSLSPYSSFPDDWREGVDNVFNIPLPNNPNSPNRLPSWKLMTNIINDSKEKVSILALAPLTNIAIALKKNPSLAQNIQQIVISGGAVNHHGNIVGKPNGFVNKCAEYNIFLDAEAAEIVIASGVPIVLVPLNATDQAPITQNLYNEFKNEKRNTSSQFVLDVIHPFVESQTNTSVYLWDPVAAAVMTNPSIGTYKKMSIKVNLQKGPTYGCTQQIATGNSINVCLSINASEFYSLFFKTISRGK